MNDKTVNNSTQPKRIFPIKFLKLRVGSDFQIFAEPSRNIRKSNDQTVYVKEAESYSVARNDKNKAIILDMNDLVIPLSRGKQ